MKKIPFLTNERLSRLMVSLMLCLGLLTPLVMTFGAESAMVQAILTACALLVLFSVLGSLKRGRILLCAVVLIAAASQLLLPEMGFFGRAFEALKSIALFFNDVPSAAPLFSSEIALMLSVGLAVVCYAFTSRSVGFFPATILVVLTLFGMWSLSQAEHLWLSAPALVALLLLISQTSHEKTNLFEVLPMALAVVLAALLILPTGETVVEPLHNAAMQLKQTISDYLFFNEPRNVFTLGTYGYYPMGSGKLGGEAVPSDTPVMTVKTERTTLLRAVVKDEYTGRSWRDTSSGKRYLYVNPRWRELRNSVFLENLPPSSVQKASSLLDQKAVTVQMQDTAASTVFTPTFLRRFSAQNDMVAYFNEAGELFITRDLERGDRYTVFAPILEGGDSALGSLIAAAPKGADKEYQEALSKYTQLPSHMEQKVYDDLNNIIAGYATPYDQACAIMRHLQRYYRYTLSPDTPPENQDFVTYFLYVGKEGYCTYYASAMTVLARMAGLPARYVEGFVAKPSSDGFAYVTGKDAHAWTEIYFEGFGWVPFDATPSQDQQEDPPPQSEPEPTPTPTPPPQSDENDEPTPTPTPPEDDHYTPPQDSEDPDFPWLWLLLAVLLIAALIRMALCTPDRVAARQKTDLERICVYGNAAYAVILLTKRTPRAGETPLDFARRADRKHLFPAPILPLWRMLALSHYGRFEPEAEQVRKARDTFAAFWRGQKPLTKLRFRLWAAFGRGAYRCMETKMQPEAPAESYSYAVRMAQKNASKKGRKGKRKKEQKPVQAPFVKPDRPLPTHEEAPAPKESAAPRRRRRSDRSES